MLHYHKMRRPTPIKRAILLLGGLLLARRAGAAGDEDHRKAQESLNKIDTGFFLLLDKKEEAKEQKSLNKIDTGFFLLLDKKDDPAAQDALNKIDTGFFLLLDKKDTPPAKEVDLGRQLFFDPRLSANKAMSCATCHNPGLAWTDGLPRARGLNQQELSRNTPTLLNVHHYQHRFFWDGRASSVEEASLIALQSRLEMNRDLKSLVVELNRVPDYARQFTELYGLSGITPENIARAVSVFVRAEATPGENAFDRFRKDSAAMTPAQVRGLEAFTGKAGCLRCHSGPAFTDSSFHNTGLKPLPGLDDPGRYAVNPVRGSWRAFKTVALRNVGLTAPYMHDGSLKTLREVVEFYDRGGDEHESQDPLIKPLGLTPAEKEDIVAFLNALSAPQKPVSVPVLPLEAGPSSAEQAMTWNLQRLRMIDNDIERKDLSGLYANATAIKENASLVKQSWPSWGACPDEISRGAWDLAHAADSSQPWSAIQEKYRKVRADTEGCRPGQAAPAPKAKVDGAQCRAQFSMDGMMRDIAGGRFSEAEKEMISVSVVEEASQYYQYRAFGAQDPEMCRSLKGLDKITNGVSRTAEWGCREWYYDLATAKAMATRSPDIEKNCRRSHAHDYPEVPRSDGEEICSVIAGNIDNPETLCSRLIPRFMGTENYKACLNEFKRYSADVYVGESQSGAPDMLYHRYVALDSFMKAYRAKDPARCGESEGCRVLMGEGTALSKPYQDKAREAYCGALERLASNASPAPQIAAGAPSSP